MLHSASQAFPYIFHLLLQSFCGAQDKITTETLAAGQP